MKRYYHGTRAALTPGDLIEPDDTRDPDAGTRLVYLTPVLDEAIWDSQLAAGEGAGRVYLVEPTGAVADVADLPGRTPPPHPSMSRCSRQPLRVLDEVRDWPLYHGTRADLQPGDLIRPGTRPNFGRRERVSNFVYVARTLDAAKWGAELAAGEGTCRIYAVEPTGPMEDDPNLTDKKFRGNPTQSFRSRDPFRIVAEITDWEGHSPEAIRAMKAGIEKLEQQGVEPIDD